MVLAGLGGMRSHLCLCALDTLALSGKSSRTAGEKPMPLESQANRHRNVNLHERSRGANAPRELDGEHDPLHQGARNHGMPAGFKG